MNTLRRVAEWPLLLALLLLSIPFLLLLRLYSGRKRLAKDCVIILVMLFQED